MPALSNITKSLCNTTVFVYTLLAVLLFFGCNSRISKKGIDQRDIEYIDSLKETNLKRYLARIDSLISLDNHTESRRALLCLKKGNIQTQLLKFKEGIKNLETSLIFFKKINDKKYLAKTYWLLGAANINLSNKVIANNQLQLALQYSKELGDKKLEANIYGSLSHIHFLYKDYKSSLSYSNKSIETYKTLNDTLGLSSTYNNLAVIHKSMGALDIAYEYNFKSLELNKLKNDTSAVAKSYNNIGNVLESQCDFNGALEYFKMANNLNKKADIQNSSPLFNLGDYYMNIDKLDSAKLHYLDALNIETNKGHNLYTLELISNLLKISKRQNDLKRTMIYQKRGDSLNNIIIKKEAQEKITLVENQYKLTASQQQLAQQHQLNNKNKTIFFVVICFLILLTLFWFQYQRSKQLAFEKEKVQLQQTVLRNQMNPHFIFNALSSIQNSIMNSEPIQTAGHLSRFSKLIRQNFDATNKATISLYDELNALENYMYTQQMRFEDKFDYAVNIGKNINTHVIEIPPLLLQPFIENAIEHGFRNTSKKGIITLSITKSERIVTYEIKDNGKGFIGTHSDKKEHSIDIFKKRLKLIGNKDEKTFSMITSEEGTIIKFSLKQ